MKKIKGFLYKDICLFCNGGKSYAILFAVFFGLTLFGIYDLSFMFAFIPVLMCMSGVSYMTVDEQIKWDRFAVATPNGRVKVVREKYLFVLLTGGIALLLESVMALILFLVTWEGLLSSLVLGLGGVAGSLLLNAISLPLMFYFGSTKGRAIALGITALLAGGLGSLSVMVALMMQGLDKAALPIVGVLTALAVIALPISYK